MNALFPDDVDGILLMPEIDVIVIGSDWVRDFFQPAPALLAKLRVCPVGVDPEYWTPGDAPRPEQALVYWKNGTEAFCEEVEDTLRRAGLTPVRVRYGEYDRDDLQARAVRVIGRRVPEQFRNAGTGARRGLGDGRADARLGSARS